MRKKIIIIIIVSIISLVLLISGISILIGNNNTNIEIEIVEDNISTDAPKFDTLFDNKMNYQEYAIDVEKLTDSTKDLVYSVYSLKQKSDGKYDINVELPYINVNNQQANEINREIILTFGQKVQSILLDDTEINTIYTVEYTSYLNDDILSVVIKSTLKEGSNAQRVIIIAYTYDLTSNKIVILKEMLEKRGINHEAVSGEILKTVQAGIDQTEALTALGYNIYQRDITSDIYEIEKSNNYFIGPNGAIYIIYAYGNSKFTSEKDIVVIN